MNFPSKKDGLFLTIFWGIIIFIIVVSVLNPDPTGKQLITYNSALGYIINLFLISFLLWIWYGTNYKVINNTLHIRSGPFKSTIDIRAIQSIRKTKNPFTAPALAMERIEIMYNMYDVVQLSPTHEEDFIQLLVEKNPNIKINVDE